MYRRQISFELEKRLKEERAFIQIVIGPRQTGKTTATKQALEATGLPYHYVDADRLRGKIATQIAVEWDQARQLTARRGKSILFIDEVHKVSDWAGTVKALWDEDTWNDVPLLVVLSGSSSLLLQKGLSDSLKGRFELLHSTHWTFSEMYEAFDCDFEKFLIRGGYPGAAKLRGDQRWLSYMRDSIIDTTLTQDILQMEDVRKPALLRSLFDMGAQHSGQELSYRKILGQLDDKGNTETIAHYLDLLNGAGMLSGLQKYSAKELVTRRTTPRFMVYDTSFMTATWHGDIKRLLKDSSLYGHLVESAVGAYLLSRSKVEGFDVCWWRDGDKEVDFVVKKGSQLVAIEVKSGLIGDLGGLAEFKRRFPDAHTLIVGSDVVPLEDFLMGGIAIFE